MNDAGFLAWLRDGRRQRVVLAELAYAYESGGVMTEGKVYLANAPYVTKPTDTVPNRRYRAAILRTASMSSGIDLATLSGQTELSVGSFELDNGDGKLDFLVDLVADGRSLACFVGDAGWPRGWFRQVALQSVVRIRPAGETRIVVEVADGRLLLDAAIQGPVISGGPEDGKPSPIVYGLAFNTAPRYVDATNNKCLALDNYKSTSYVADVRDAGVSLGERSVSDNPVLFSGDNTALTANAGTDTLNYTGHGLANNDVVLVSTTGTVFGGLTANTRYWVKGVAGADFQLANSRGGAAVDITGTAFSGVMSFQRFRYMDTLAANGQIQLSAPSEGQVTADVAEVNTLSREPFAMMKLLIEDWAADQASRIDADSVTAADIALRARLDAKYIFASLVVQERANLLVVLRDLLAPIGGWYGSDHDGAIRCGMMDLTGLASQAVEHEIAEGDVLGELGVDVLPIAFGGAAVGIDRNWTVQTDGLLASLTETEKALYARAYRYESVSGNGHDAAGATYLPTWWAHHKTAITQRFESLLSRQTSLPVSVAGSEVARELVADQQPWRRAVRVTLGLEAYSWRLGAVVRLTYPRFGFDGGVNCRLAEREIDLDAGEITLTLVTQVTPDTTTTDYP